MDVDWLLQWMMCVISAVRVVKVSESRPRAGSARLHARLRNFGEVMRWAKQYFLKAELRRCGAV